MTLFDDEWRTPLDLATASEALVAIAESDFTGVLHLGGPQRLSRVEMGVQLAAAIGVEASIRPLSRNAAGQPEPRPRDVSLDSSRWRTLFPAQRWPAYDEAIRGMITA